MPDISSERKLNLLHKPANGEVDTPLIYADYYFLEALLRRGKKLTINHSPAFFLEALLRKEKK